MALETERDAGRLRHEFSHSEPDMSDEQIRHHLHRAAMRPRWGRT